MTDQSRKGLQVIQTIKDVADRLVMYERLGVAVNRITQDVIPFGNPSRMRHLEIRNDEAQIVNDIQGKACLNFRRNANF
ncbi:MAG: hypothetical protein ACLVJO_01940 [[Clostridium] scindens]